LRKTKSGLTKRAPDVWDASRARFTSISRTRGFGFFLLPSIVHARPHAGQRKPLDAYLFQLFTRKANWRKQMGKFVKVSDKRIFALIGALIGGGFKFFYDIGFVVKSFLSTPKNAFQFDYTLAYQSDPSPFFLGFGIIAFALGIYYSTKKSYLDNGKVNRFLLVSVFTLCGFAYSLWLHMHAASESLEIGDIPFHAFFISFAVSLFVFIFSSTFLGMPNNKKALIISASFSVLVLLFVLPTVAIGYSLSTAIGLGLVSYLVVLSLVYITIGYHYKDYFSNILVNTLIFAFVFSALPIVGPISLLLLPFANIYYFFRIRKSSKPKKSDTEVSPTSNFSKKITTTFEWVFSLPSVLLNCTVYGSFLSVLPYLGITRYLQESNQLSRIDHRRSYILGFYSFIVHFSFFIFYDFAAPLINSVNGILFILIDVFVWTVISYIGTQSIGYCLFELKNEE
jgi:hypothetical protein